MGKIFLRRNCLAFKAFSLIELLVTLIIISLLFSAFSPVIIKKLKASAITVGSFEINNQDESNDTSNELTKQDCDKFNALFISKEMNDGVKPICVTKYNIGDNGTNLADSVTAVNVGTTCSDSNCCWKGKTSNNCSSDGNSDSNYDGCYRTVCKWSAANSSCLAYAPNGSKAGDWRLPTKEEVSGWQSNISFLSYFKGKEGMMVCSYNSKNYGSVLCSHNPVCLGSNDGFCWPHRIWTSECSNGKCYGIQNELNSTSDGYIFSLLFMNATEAYSARCVYDGQNQVSDNKEDNCLTESNNKCTSCASGFVLLNGQCLTCEPSNGFVKVGTNLCVMQYNIGDGKYEESWDGVQKCIAGNSCTVTNGSSTSATTSNLTPTCWQGTTASTCNSNYGNYSGCTRTVCNWTGANQMCTNIGWRLPTQSELQSFTNTTYSSTTLASNGLMFCDHLSSSTLAPVCSFLGSGCTGTYDTNCHPHNVWSSTFSTASTAYDRHYSTQWYDVTYYLGYGFSTRCVKDL